MGLVAACGYSSGGSAVGGGGGGDPGSGGGPTGPGAAGNPLAVALDFSVENASSLERTETIRASVPFPKGGYQSTSNLIVSGHQTAWLPLQYWADGTVKMAQAQFTDTLLANETKDYSVARDEVAETGPFTRNTWVEQAGAGLQIGAEVRDTFSVPYRAVVAGPGEVLQESPMVQTHRWHLYHMSLNGGGIGRDYLTSTFYVTEFRDMPFVMVDWIIGNDYQGRDVVPPGNSDPNLHPLGTVDVLEANFLCKGMSGVQAYLPELHEIDAPASHGDGFTALKVMEDDYIGDAQTRRYRFLLRFEPSGADPLAVARWRDSADAMLDAPLYPLAKHETWLDTGAAGLLGGPVAGPANAAVEADNDYQRWLGRDHFGTWGVHGDLYDTHTTGTPRNHPLTPELAHAIQGQHQRLLQTLEQKAWVQAMRPYHLWGLTVGAEEDIYIWGGLPHSVSTESLGREALANNDPYLVYRSLGQGSNHPHGWYAFDHEHFTTDLLFDYWCLTGDEWAKEEMRQLGESLKGVMRLSVYASSRVQSIRAEGWCMQAFAQVYQATQDESIKEYGIRRAQEVVEAHRNASHPSKAIKFDSNYPGTRFPLDHKFYPPWQHGAVLYGYLGAYQCFEAPILLSICEEVIPMLDYSWVTNINHPTLGFVAEGLRYYVPVEHNGSPIPADYWDSTAGVGPRLGSNPLGGAHEFLTGGLFHLAYMTQDQQIRDKALHYGYLLLEGTEEWKRWDKWHYCVPSYYFEPQ